MSLFTKNRKKRNKQKELDGKEAVIDEYIAARKAGIITLLNHHVDKGNMTKEQADEFKKQLEDSENGTTKYDSNNINSSGISKGD